MLPESDAMDAIRLIRSGDFKVGRNWEAVHEIAQRHEGTALFDAIHALLHRIEGDTWNAEYWDRRAGTNFGGDGHKSELAAIERMAQGD